MDRLEKLLEKRFKREKEWLLNKHKMEIEERVFRQLQIEGSLTSLAEKYPQVESDLIRFLR